MDTSSEHHPSNDPRYASSSFEEEFTESLSTTLDRVLPFFEDNIKPDLAAGKTVLGMLFQLTKFYYLIIFNIFLHDFNR